MRVERLALTVLLLAAPLAAEEPPPSLELLEFLGSFETAGGEWVDPVELEVPPSEEAEARGGQEK
jgi:hypothetical protein